MKIKEKKINNQTDWMCNRVRQYYYCPTLLLMQSDGKPMENWTAMTYSWVSYSSCYWCWQIRSDCWYTISSPSYLNTRLLSVPPFGNSWNKFGGDQKVRITMTSFLVLAHINRLTLIATKWERQMMGVRRIVWHGFCSHLTILGYLYFVC